MSDVTKTAQLLHFFAKENGREGVTRKRLAKLAFMADILARQYLGRAISDLEYIKDQFGPYARELPDFTQELVDLEFASEFEERTSATHRKIVLRDRGKPLTYGFTRGENEILAYVMANYAAMDLQE